MGAFGNLLRYVLAVHKVITPEEAEDFLVGQDLHAQDGRIPYLLTFDDGFKSQGEVAKGILNRYGVKAVFFVCPGLMDIPREWHREAIARHIFDGSVHSADLPDDMAFISWSGLKDLIASGHTIGSHTAHHRRLSRLNRSELQQEIFGSAELLRSRLGTLIRWFAHPFGDLGSISLVSYEMIGSCYQFCCSGIRGVNSGRTHPLALLREQLDLSSPFEYQKFVLEGGLDFYYGLRARRLQALITKATMRGGA